MVSISKNTLVEGDALYPTDTDLIAQQGRLEEGAAVPDGWRVLSVSLGEMGSLVARVVFRYEVEDQDIDL